MTKSEMTAAAGMSYAGYRRLEDMPKSRVRLKTLRSLSSALGIELDRLIENIKIEEGPIEQGEFDQNIEPYSEEKVPEIPEFNLSVAAGGWVDVSEIGEIREPGLIDHGLFRLRIRGDSMLPLYREEDLIEFKCLVFGRDALEIGRDYYMQRSDGMATFKRLEKADQEAFVLRPLNRKKYPKPLRVERVEVVRMAEAVAKITKLGQ